MSAETPHRCADHRTPGRLRARLRAAVVWALCGTLHLQGLAQTGSTLLQEPPFTASEPAPNVMLMFDDSGSTGGHRLPSPVGMPTGPVGSKGTIRGLGPNAANVWAERTWSIDLHHDFALRAPALNPLWYNPAVRYLPWNKDGVLLPAASIGGSTPGIHHGSLGSRADASSLTERDPRIVWNGTAWVPVGPAAGRGLLGTVPSDPMGAQPDLGRRVTSASPAVDFRYHKMPFDFGPVIPGRPGAEHANQAWTTHHEVNSPLDLFSRPVVAIPGATQCTTVTENVPTPRNGCFSSLASCQANQPSVPLATTTTWTRADCQGNTQTFTTNPGPLTCHQARCPAGGQTNWTAPQPGGPPTLACDFQYTGCTGTVVTTPTHPGTVSCGWRRLGCDGSYGGLGAVTSATSNPGNLTCYRSRACTTPLPGFGAWTTTPASASGTCFQRQTCTGSLEYSPTDPGPLSCGFTRAECDGSVRSYSTNPGPLTCWRRNTCSGVSAIFTSDPGPLDCGWRRTSCSGATESFTRDPGPLTCYTRSNCDGSTTGPTADVLHPLTCPRGDNVPLPLVPTASVRTATSVANPATSFTRPVANLGARTASPVSVLETVTRTAEAPSTVTVARLTQQNTSFTRHPTAWTNGSCTSGVTSCTAQVPTPRTTCITAPTVNVPNPEALTPARYYLYGGSGSRIDPASYTVVQIDRNRPSGDAFPVVDAVTGVAPTAATSARTDCAARTHCTWPEEARNFANWYLYYRNRMFAAQAVMSDAMSAMTSESQQQIRLGYGRIGHTVGAVDPWRSESRTTLTSIPEVDGFANPGALVRGVRPFIAGTPERRAFFDWLHGQAWAGPTPNREAIDSVGRYFSWTDSRGPWGATPGTASNLAQLACRRNYAFLTTDGEWTNFSAGQPLLPSSGPPGVAGPGTPGAALRQEGPTITGAGVNAGSSFRWRPGDWPQYTGGGTDTGTLSDVAAYYWNRDLRPDLPNVLSPINTPGRSNPAYWQSMSTFVVAYGLTASMDNATVRDAIGNSQPVNWPQVDTSPMIATGGNRVNDSFRAAMVSRGNFFSATSLPELRTGILSTFQQVNHRTGSAGGVATTGPVSTSDSLTFFPSYTSGSWTGSLRAYPHRELATLAAGGSATPTWTATVPAPAQRRVFTSTVASNGTRSGVAFQASALSAAQRTQLAGSGWTAEEAVAWLRGDTSLELSPSGTSGKFRRRAGPLADFVNSAPLHVRAPNHGYDAMPGVGASYAAYVTGRRNAGPGTVYIGGNGGMLHAFAADTGVERFAYVPRGVYPDLASLTSPGYVHRYFVDGQVTAGDWHDGSAWRSVVVGTTGAGGASIFAIDTTQVSNPTASQVLWDLTRADNAHIGHVMGRGIVGRIRTGSGPNDFRWVYINGNGYESGSNRAALLVVGLADGAVTAIPVGDTWSAASGLAARNGMGPPTVRYDAQRNIVGVYAGDKQGNLWRFDFSEGIPQGASGFGRSTTPLFTATDATGRRQPITAAPRLVPHPQGGLYIVFGTGKLIDAEDPTSVAPQALYGIWERPGQTSPITTSELRTLSSTTAPDGTRSFAIAGLDATRHRGWTFPLAAGERVIADPSAELGLLSLASFRPSAIEDPCTGGGSSNVYRIDLAKGVVDIAAMAGSVGMITPVLGLNSSQRTLAAADLSGSIRSGGTVAPVPPGTPPSAGSQCTLYGASIQGRPSVIARACPPFSPIRVWRQPLR